MLMLLLIFAIVAMLLLLLNFAIGAATLAIGFTLNLNIRNYELVVYTTDIIDTTKCYC